MSLGAQILMAADTNPSKQAGVAAFAQGDAATAVTQFQASLQTNRNDPEALIYLNNAKVASPASLKIAVSVPIGGNLNVAKEILRGVAQAQDEVNGSGGINGAFLQVLIANDNNDPALVKQVAQALVKDASILAVVGHNSSDASLAAAPVYQAGGLVMISPTSDTKALSGIGNYIFRTIPSVRFQADALARYSFQKARRKNIAVCIDSQSSYSQSLKEEFTASAFAESGRLANVNCDFAAPNFNPATTISDAIAAGADGLLLIPSVDKLSQAIDVAGVNQKKLALLGSSAMYTFQTLQQGQNDVNGMVLAVAWHPAAVAGNPFADEATKLWGGPVNWRTAMAYDATMALIAGLRQGNSRQALQAALSNPSFRTNGATGTIQFLPSGDRSTRATLVQIRPGQVSGTGYDFVPIPPAP